MNLAQELKSEIAFVLRLIERGDSFGAKAHGNKLYTKIEKAQMVIDMVMTDVAKAGRPLPIGDDAFVALSKLATPKEQRAKR